MEVLIIEDEKPAQERLIQQVHEYDDSIRIAGKLVSVRESVQWLKRNRQPDLILLDIQLSDGSSLEIFRNHSVTCPVIFTTAYDKYILQAFDYNCIDYLLKPVKQEKLAASLDKYFKFKSHFTQDLVTLLSDTGSPAGARYRKRITVRKGIDFISIPVEEIAFFYTEYKLVFAVTHRGERFSVEKTLSDLEAELNPVDFFRMNRKYLASIRAIGRFQPFEKGKIFLELRPPVREPVLVSQEKAALFKRWMDR